MIHREAQDRMIDWLSKPTEEQENKKLLSQEKRFWSDQLRKAHNVEGMSYKRYDGTSACNSC